MNTWLNEQHLKQHQEHDRALLIIVGISLVASSQLIAQNQLIVFAWIPLLVALASVLRAQRLACQDFDALVIGEGTQYDAQIKNCNKWSFFCCVLGLSSLITVICLGALKGIYGS